jgi:monothiol glutaredoxin
VLRLEVDAQFNPDLHFGPKVAGDFEIQSNGVTLHVARDSAARADGVTIDFVAGPGGGGFKIDNPNEPPRVKAITAPALKSLLDMGNVELFDVRPDDERARASIPQAKKLDAAGQKYLASLDKKAPIALHCHHGTRSRNAAEQLIRQGYTNVYNLEGGIAAWSRDIDPTIPQY